MGGIKNLSPKVEVPAKHVHDPAAPVLEHDVRARQKRTDVSFVH